MREFYKTIAGTIKWIDDVDQRDPKNADIINNQCLRQEWIDKNLPSGSGINSGSKVDWDKSKVDKIIITSSYHVMDENGYYCDMVYFKVIITPSLVTDFDIKIKFDTPRDKRVSEKHALECYFYDLFYFNLMEKFDYIIKKEV